MKTLQEKIAIMQAYANGAKIEFYTDEGWKLWAGVYEPSWNWHNYEYRIAQPESKKVKMCAFIALNGELRWFIEGSPTPTSCKHIPELDKEITLP